MRRQFLTLFMTTLLATPVWPGSAPLGYVSSSANATLASTQAVAGSTVFDGDSLKVSAGGSLDIRLTGGSRTVLNPETEARLNRNAPGASLNLKSGTALIVSSSKSRIEGRLSDVAFRPADPQQASIGWLGVNGSGHVILYAEKGNWLVSTDDDGGTVLLHQGSRMEGTLTTVNQQGGVQQHKSKKKLAAFFIATGVSALIAATIAFETSTGRYCIDPPVRVICNPPVPSVSPVGP